MIRVKPPQEPDVYIITRDTNDDNQIMAIFKNYELAKNRLEFLEKDNLKDRFSLTPWCFSDPA